MKNMKRMLSFVLALLLCVPFIYTSTGAAEVVKPTVTITGSKIEPNTQIDEYTTITENNVYGFVVHGDPGQDANGDALAMAQLTLNFSYDNTVLEWYGTIEESVIIKGIAKYAGRKPVEYSSAPVQTKVYDNANRTAVEYTIYEAEPTFTGAQDLYILLFKLKEGKTLGKNSLMIDTVNPGGNATEFPAVLFLTKNPNVADSGVDYQYGATVQQMAKPTVTYPGSDSDTLQSVAITGESTIAVPALKAGQTQAVATLALKATAQGMDGEITNAEMAWAIEGTAPAGVSIDAKTGVLSVTNTAQAGTVTVKVTATFGGVSKSAQHTVTITRATPVPSTVTLDKQTVVDDGANNQTVKATAYDQFGSTISGVTWSVEPAGDVTIGATTGVITVKAKAAAMGYTIKATKGNASATATLTVSRAGAALTSVVLDPETAVADGSADTTVQATALDQFGGTVSDVTWSIAPQSTDVTINTTTGKISVKATAQAQTYTVTATKGNVSKTASLRVTREAPVLTSMTLDSAMVTLEGADKTVKATAKDQFGGTMTSGITWSVEPAGDVAVDTTGTITVKATAKTGTYTMTAAAGKVTKTATLKVARDMAYVTVTLAPETFVYNGKEQKPAVTVKDGEVTLTENTHYTLTYKDDKNGNDLTSVGTKTIAIAGKGDYYSGSVSKTYTITKQPQEPVLLSGVGETQVYGDAVTATLLGGSGTGSYTLTSSDPAVVSVAAGQNNSFTLTIHKVGKVTLTAGRAGDTNYEPASTIVDLTIAPKDLTGKASVKITSSAEELAFTGKPIVPKVEVKDGETVLVDGTDYTRASNSVAIGTGTVTITFQGNYMGTATAEFTISQKSMASDTIQVYTVSSAPYQGGAVQPYMIIENGGVAMKQGEDYTVSYAKNDAVGTATMTITGTGNYQGTRDVTFEITKGTLQGMAVIAPAQEGGVVAEGLAVTAQVYGANYQGEWNYQWYRGTTAIEGATEKTYTLTADDAAAQLSVKLTLPEAASANYEINTGLTSDSIAGGKTLVLANAILTKGPVLNKDDVVGVQTTLESDVPTSITWLADGKEVGKGETLTITSAHLGKQIMAKVAVGGDYTGTLATEPATAYSAPEQPKVTFTGGGNTKTVSWTVANDGGAPVVQYILTIMKDNEVVSTTKLYGDAKNYQVELTEAGYTAQVVAINEYGSSAAGSAAWSSGSGSGSGSSISGGGGGGGGTSANSTTVTNPDGTIVTTVKNADGSTTVTTKSPDGATAVEVTDKDGKLVSSTKTDAKGNKSETKIKDNVTTTIVSNKDGGTSTFVTDTTGKTTGEVSVSQTVAAAAQQNKTAVLLPMNALQSYNSTVTLRVSVAQQQENTTLNVQIPLEQAKQGLVAMVVDENGNKTILPSVITQDGLNALLPTGTEVQIVDNSTTFTDVTDAHWSKDSVDFVTAHGLFQGVSKDTFAPETAMTRAMLATVLYNMEGKKKVESGTAFTDVASDQWYADAIAWAASRGIVTGYNDGSFRPNKALTREELMTMLYRYEGTPETTGTLDRFNDANAVSAFAQNAMRWGVEQGLISGYTDGTVKPAGEAKRSEIAKIISVYEKNNIAKQITALPA